MIGVSFSIPSYTITQIGLSLEIKLSFFNKYLNLSVKFINSSLSIKSSDSFILNLEPLNNLKKIINIINQINWLMLIIINLS